MTLLTTSQLTPQDLTLVEEARKAATTLSYSPYSHFRVGAAALLDNGTIVKGANQENVSYPVGICAERSTIATAHNIFPNMPIKAIALAACDETGSFTNEPVTPCGMCRQVIAEWEHRFNKQIRIIMSAEDKITIAKGINELLPLAFS